MAGSGEHIGKVMLSEVGLQLGGLPGRWSAHLDAATWLLALHLKLTLCFWRLRQLSRLLTFKEECLGASGRFSVVLVTTTSTSKCCLVRLCSCVRLFQLVRSVPLLLFSNYCYLVIGNHIVRHFSSIKDYFVRLCIILIFFKVICSCKARKIFCSHK